MISTFLGFGTKTNLKGGTDNGGRSLAAVLGVTTRTIRRMVGRCEIPPGTRLGGHTVWFAGRVLAYIDRRLEKAEVAAARRDAALGRHKGTRSA